VTGSSRLAVFDIDGTLTDTNAVDDECFVEAVGGVLGIDAAALDWSEAPHITDTGLLRWLAERHRGRLPELHEMDAVQSRFVESLREAAQVTPERFQSVAGAQSVFGELRTRGWHVAVATGGWQASAVLKLRAIALDVDDLVFASSSDAETRVEILLLARQRARVRFGALDRVVSVGDGIWDVRAAAQLGWPFVGIGTGAAAGRLRAAGASHVLPDLTDIAGLCSALEHATVPMRAET
jgi:phosphoglycolate phosphatase-like HAD superfamily hydrolase